MSKRKPATKKAEPKIVNMYDKIPKSFLTNISNPNFNLHRFKMIFRAVCVAPSGSGKTNFLVNLLNLFSQGKGTFNTIHIITRNADEPLYNWLKDISEGQIRITEGVKSIPDLDKFDKKEVHLVVFDDLVLDKNQKPIAEYYIRARKLSVNIIYLSQSYYDVPTIIRKNCNYLIILKLSGSRETTTILKEAGVGLSKDQLLNMYKYATNEKFSPLIIDLDSDETERFRKGFDEILNPEDFHNKLLN